MNLLKRLTLIAVTLLLSIGANALEVGEAAPCVVLEHYQNGNPSNHCIRDPQVEGRPVIIEFFSIFCSDCLKNLPKIKQLANDLEGKATLRLVSVDRNKEAVMEYIRLHNINLEVAFDTDRDAKTAYRVVSTPTLYVLDQENVIRNKHVGVLDSEATAEVIKTVEAL